MNYNRGDKVSVKGTAIVAGISRNGIKYTRDELEKGSKSLVGVTMLKDHNPLTDNSIGRVEKQSMNGNKQLYEGWVEEDGTNLVQKIKDKRLRVSVGATVEKLVRESEDSEVLTARGIRYMELSTTPTPGIAEASIETAEGEEAEVKECFDLKQLKSTLTESQIGSIIESLNLFDAVEKEENKMTEEEKTQEPVQEPQEETTEEPKEEAVEEPKEEVKEEPAEETKEEPEEEVEEKKDETSESLKELVKEVRELKSKLEETKTTEVVEEEKIQVKEEGKMEELKTKEDIQESHKEYENYVIESESKGNKAFFRMPKGNGEY